MIVVAETYAKLSTTIMRSALEARSESILDYAEGIVQEHYRDRYEQYTFRVHVRVERGSTRVWVTVTTLASILTFYGDIRQSVDYLIKDAKYLGSTLLPEMSSQLDLGREQPDYVQKRLGVPGQILQLFHKVERREISAEEATRRAVDLLCRQSGPEAVAEASGLTEKLAVELRDVTRHRSPKRLPFDGKNRQLDLPPPQLPPRRRTGVIVSRDRDGKVRVRTY